MKIYTLKYYNCLAFGGDHHLGRDPVLALRRALLRVRTNKDSLTPHLRFTSFKYSTNLLAVTVSDSSSKTIFSFTSLFPIFLIP